MVDQETLMQALSDFTPSLVNPILGANLQELVERVSGVSGISWAGVGMAGGGRLGFATAVDGYTSRVEQVPREPAGPVRGSARARRRPRRMSRHCGVAEPVVAPAAARR